jgi:hypothetical protein
MRRKKMAEPTDIAGMHQRMDGVGEENERHRDPNDVETAARIVRGGAIPISLHKRS